MKVKPQKHKRKKSKKVTIQKIPDVLHNNLIFSESENNQHVKVKKELPTVSFTKSFTESATNLSLSSSGMKKRLRRPRSKIQFKDAVVRPQWNNQPTSEEETPQSHRQASHMFNIEENMAECKQPSSGETKEFQVKPQPSTGNIQELNQSNSQIHNEGNEDDLVVQTMNPSDKEDQQKLQNEEEEEEESQQLSESILKSIEKLIRVNIDKQNKKFNLKGKELENAIQTILQNKELIKGTDKNEIEPVQDQQEKQSEIFIEDAISIQKKEIDSGYFHQSEVDQMKIEEINITQDKNQQLIEDKPQSVQLSQEFTHPFNKQPSFNPMEYQQIQHQHSNHVSMSPALVDPHLPRSQTSETIAIKKEKKDDSSMDQYLLEENQGNPSESPDVLKSSFPKIHSLFHPQEGKVHIDILSQSIIEEEEKSTPKGESSNKLNYKKKQKQEKEDLKRDAISQFTVAQRTFSNITNQNDIEELLELLEFKGPSLSPTEFNKQLKPFLYSQFKGKQQESYRNFIKTDTNFDELENFENSTLIKRKKFIDTNSYNNSSNVFDLNQDIDNELLEEIKKYEGVEGGAEFYQINLLNCQKLAQMQLESVEEEQEFVQEILIQKWRKQQCLFSDLQIEEFSERINMEHKSKDEYLDRQNTVVEKAIDVAYNSFINPSECENNNEGMQKVLNEAIELMMKQMEFNLFLEDFNCITEIELNEREEQTIQTLVKKESYPKIRRPPKLQSLIYSQDEENIDDQDNGDIEHLFLENPNRIKKRITPVASSQSNNQILQTKKTEIFMNDSQQIISDRALAFQQNKTHFSSQIFEKKSDKELSKFSKVIKHAHNESFFTKVFHIQDFPNFFEIFHPKLQTIFAFDLDLKFQKINQEYFTYVFDTYFNTFQWYQVRLEDDVILRDGLLDKKLEIRSKKDSNKFAIVNKRENMWWNKRPKRKFDLEKILFQPENNNLLYLVRDQFNYTQHLMKIMGKMFEKYCGGRNNYLLTIWRHPSIIKSKSNMPLLKRKQLKSRELESTSSPKKSLMINKDPINLNFHEEEESLQDSSPILNLKELTTSDLYESKALRRSYQFQLSDSHGYISQIQENGMYEILCPTLLNQKESEPINIIQHRVFSTPFQDFFDEDDYEQKIKLFKKQDLKQKKIQELKMKGMKVIIPIKKKKIKFQNFQTGKRKKMKSPLAKLRKSEVQMFKIYNNLKNVYLDEFGELRTLGWNH